MRSENSSIQIAGLTSGEAAKRLERHGPNALAEAKSTLAWRIFLRQFKGTLALSLVAAAMVALALGEHIDSITIGMVVLLNGVRGFVQEWRAEIALATLRKKLAHLTRVIRDQKLIEIDRCELVPGDLILFSAGAQVAADDVLAPPDQRAKLFGLNALAGRAIAPFGPAIVSAVNLATGNQRAGIIVVA